MATETKKTADFKIKHVATGYEYRFNGVLRVFSESFTSDWNEESVFGRMDPILAFKGTRRTLSVELLIGGAGKDAPALVKQAEALPALMYPTYSNKSGALSIKDPPLVRIFAKNFLKAKANEGLLCAIKNISVDRGESFHETAGTDTMSPLAPNKVILKMDLIPLHEYDIGWIESADAAGKYSFGPNATPEYYFSNRKITTG